MKLKVDGYTNLYRDSDTNSIIIQDKNAFESYIENLKTRTHNNDIQNQLINDVKKLQNDINEITNLLEKIMVKLND